MLVEKQVIKVLFDDNKRANGVEYQSNPKYLANPEFLATKYTARRTVGARKLVVVSAGANATPGILERSGIGDPKVLERAGVPVVQDLPGVGNEYQVSHLRRRRALSLRPLSGYAGLPFRLSYPRIACDG